MSNCLKYISLAFFLLFLHAASAQPGRKSVKEVGVANFQQLDAVVQRNLKLLGGHGLDRHAGV